MPSGTDSRCMRHDFLGDDGIGDGAKMVLKAFARDILECGDTDSGDFCGTACWTAAPGF